MESKSNKINPGVTNLLKLQKIVEFKLILAQSLWPRYMSLNIYVFSVDLICALILAICELTGIKSMNG